MLLNVKVISQINNQDKRLSATTESNLYAVLFIDLDGFKVVNDSLGHLMGDELLKIVAKRLQNCLRTGDTVARLGGDEFAILLEEIKDYADATYVAERIKNQLQQPFQLNDYEVFSSASIGITYSVSSAYKRPEELLRDADAAMYHAKASGKGSYSVFDPKMQIGALARLQLQNDLRRAIKQEEFLVYYQPIFSLSTGYLCGFEALIRWKHPSRGWVSPVEFIPVAEETGLINEIGWWVLQEACCQLRLWQQQFPEANDLMMNVNLSAHQLQQLSLVEQIDKILQQTGLKGNFLKLEITESSFLQKFSSEVSIVNQLKALGIGLCIDDFGTGYSSLSRLHEFPIDTLKIDRSFVRRLDTDCGHAEIVQTIVTLAHSLDMNVVAEGVETQVQLEKLHELQCELMQGYLLSKPVDSEMASKFIGVRFQDLLS